MLSAFSRVRPTQARAADLNTSSDGTSIVRSSAFGSIRCENGPRGSETKRSTVPSGVLVFLNPVHSQSATSIAERWSLELLQTELFCNRVRGIFEVRVAANPDDKSMRLRAGALGVKHYCH